MDTSNALDKIEKLIEENKFNTGQKQKEETKNDISRNPINELFFLVISLIIDIFKSPFKLLARYIKNELFDAVKKDMMIYAILGMLMGIMFIFFSVLWLSVSVAVGVYYFDQGKSILTSVLYSLSFQATFFMFIALIAFFSMTKLNSIKVLRKISKLK